MRAIGLRALILIKLRQRSQAGLATFITAMDLSSLELTRKPASAFVLALGLLAASAPGWVHATQYLCKNASGVAIDRHSLQTSDSEDEKGRSSIVAAPQEWIVDPQRGWRRSDVSFFSGACSEDKGYLVCKDTNATYGEATFSLHPDKHNFLLVYMDYGLNALAFVGSCKAP